MKWKARIQFKDVFADGYKTTITIDVEQMLTLINRNQTYLTEKDNIYCD